MSATTEAGHRARPAGRDIGGWLLAVLCALPEKVAGLFLCGCLTVAVELQLKVFSPYTALVITVVLFALSWPMYPRVTRVDRRSALGVVVAVQFLLGWIWVNAAYYEQELSVYRDPSIYALRGWWLTHHSSPLVDMSGAATGAHNVPGASIAWGGFPISGHQAYPQGASLVPGLIAVAGRFGGLRVMLASNLIIGAVGLLIIYGVARRLMGPMLALVPMIVLATSMPMVYFSRASYTEPTALAAVFGGLLILSHAVRAPADGDSVKVGTWRRTLMFAVAGLSVGASTLARVDGVLAVGGTLVGLGTLAAFTRSSAERGRLRLGIVAFAAGAAVTCGIGGYDLKHNSTFYFTGQEADFRKLVYAAVLALLVALALTVPLLDRIRNLAVVHAGRLAVIGLWTMLAICVVMISRPLWWKGKFGTTPIGQHAVANRQRAAGLPIEPSRTYDERTIQWIGWYFGWAVVILSAIGLALLVRRIIQRRDPVAVVLFGAICVVSAFYLNDVSITPDQIWAARRLLPVILPGFAILAGFALVELARSRWSVVLIPVAVLALMSPVLQWRHVATTPEFGGELPAVNAMCATLERVGGSNPHVIVTGTPPATGYWEPALTVVCHASVVTLRTATSDAMLQVRKNWSDARVAVLTFKPTTVPWADGVPAVPSVSGAATLWDQPLLDYPKSTNELQINIWIGALGDDGRVSPA